MRVVNGGEAAARREGTGNLGGSVDVDPDAGVCERRDWLIEGRTEKEEVLIVEGGGVAAGLSV